MKYFNLLKSARPSNFAKLYMASRVHSMTLWQSPLPKNKPMKTETVPRKENDLHIYNCQTDKQTNKKARKLGR